MDDGLSRIIRLVGNGADEMSGGGLPLPDAFGAVLQYLLDEGPASQEVLGFQVVKAVRFKEKRILAIWGSWEAFTEDIVIQLGLSKLIRADSMHDEGKVWHWRISEDFMRGSSHEVIPGAAVAAATGGSSANAVTVTVFDAATRQYRNETAKLVFAVSEMKARIQRAGRMTEEIDEYLRAVLRELEGEGESRPPKPPPEPDVMVECRECGVRKARTYANFTVYWSRDRWRWHPNCRNCRTPAKYLEFQDEIIAVVTGLTAENGGRPPYPEEVTARMGMATENRTVARSWDSLAAKGLLPPRPEPGRQRSRAVSWNEEAAAPAPPKKGQMPWYRSWVTTAGWHTQRQARAAWNEQHPDMMLLSEKASAFRHASKEMIDRGEMERRPEVPVSRRRQGGGRRGNEYRYLPPQERRQQ